jgi:hypothetical protein
MSENVSASPDAHYDATFNGFRIDPYRVALANGVTHPVQFHMMKKLMRGSRKGHSEQELIRELQCCLDRWKQLIAEDQKNQAEEPQVSRKIHPSNFVEPIFEG